MSAPRLLPDNKAAIVTYCSNEACGNSQAVADRLARLGYTAVRMYRVALEAGGLLVSKDIQIEINLETVLDRG